MLSCSFHFIMFALRPYFSMSLRTVAALAGALSAFDAEHVEFSFDVSEDEIGPPRHDGDITTCRGDRRCLMAKKPAEGSLWWRRRQKIA